MASNPAQERVVQQYYNHVKQHGPLPRNWEVKTNGDYVNTRGERTSVYPMSAEGRASGVKLEQEQFVGVYKVAGASNTASYFAYDPSCWVWTAGETSDVLYKALTYSKATNKEGNLVSRQDVDAEIKITRQKKSPRKAPYHPMNQSEKVFRDEDVAADVACAFHRSLWILCPRLQKKHSWNLPWHPGLNFRPSVHLRFGFGDQGDFPPIVVGLLPVHGGEPNAHWFFAQPCGKWELTWKSLYVNPVFDVNEIAKQLAVPKAPALYVQYALVACHRTLLLSPDSLQGVDMHNWIKQYIEHLVKTHPRGAKQVGLAQFKYNGKIGLKPYQGPNRLKIDQVKLDSWIIAAKKGSPMYVFAWRWNDLMVAKIRHANDSTLANWKAFVETQERVAQLTTDS
ncbi:hypothetical protein BKA63DRAFT_490182 [Paraphoma chrysanthemicola]|nr:hypothetical protein BKA63DRAFT_490182 [Paraphoma chrysanthemicola]